VSFWRTLLPPEALRWLKQFSSARISASLPRSSVVSSNWSQKFASSVRAREYNETVALHKQAREADRHSPFASREFCRRFIYEMIVDICAGDDEVPSGPLADALWDSIAAFLVGEGLAPDFAGREPSPNLTLEEGVELRAVLRRNLIFVRDHERLLPIWREKLVYLFSGMLSYLPPSVFADIGPDGGSLDDAVVLPTVRAFEMCADLREVLERSIVTFLDQDIVNAHLFDRMRDTLDRNIVAISGGKGATKFVFPSEQKNGDPQYLVDAYLGSTPLHGFFEAGLPFAIPFPARFEHTHVIGGTGHGKTQLLQFLIHHDLERAREDGRSVVVIDSQGDLIRTISALEHFSPGSELSLADRYLSLDPSDIEHPVALNMFDFNRERLSGYAPLDREKILNATVELYDYFFGALLGAELTQRQGLIFRYLARLLIEIPGATIHTLRELMESGEKFLPYMEKLTGTTRSFFATRFFDRSFNETKKQILARLWGVLSNSALERMFSHRESKVDMFDLLNSGKIVFVNTAKDLLGEEGASIFGRFFVALIAQAAVQRAAIPAHERRPVFLYIDEAQDYFDANIASLLTQARKYRVGLVFAHQSLDQLSGELRGSVLANTTIRFAGGLSAKDASAIAPEFRSERDFLLSQRRGTDETHFACYVRNYTPRALSVSVPLGFVEALPRMSETARALLLEANRARYSGTPEPIAEASFATVGGRSPSLKHPVRIPAPEAVSSPIDVIAPPMRAAPTTTASKTAVAAPSRRGLGRGGEKHKYLQQLVKQLAEERGFLARIEEAILGGTGQVDVSLTRESVRIACEISITTKSDHELQNVEKCIAAGYREIVLIGRSERHVKALGKFIEENLEEGHGATIRYASPETLLDFLDQFALVEPTVSTVRGYNVKTKRKVVSPEEQAARRAALVEVVAKSLSKSKRD
jgi:Type IV secretion-system coupling protein DNA-binding domain